MSKENSNSTMKNEFLLTRFSDVWEYRILHAMLFLLMYLATLMGNLLIVSVTTLDMNLHTPMYFFLRNLSVLDMCYISATVPKACATFLTNNRTISMAGCASQVFMVFFCGFVEVMFLTSMAHDHYVAICQPLHYPMIMTPRICVWMTLASVLSGLVFSGFHTGNTFWLHFCQSNVVNQFFCDTPSLLKLSCSNTFSNEISIFISTFLIVGGCFAFITRSYVYIFFTVLKFPISTDRGKAFSTCVPHIIIVSIFLLSGAAVHIKPTSNSHTIQDMIISMFYSIVPPLLNPIIYSLRNKQIIEAVKKLMKRMLYSGK
ncbi:olfactory receptor 14C36-like [Dasypus novemcinctus]|uniref:olfactory receptor 14C36-like n=1 Tax=Dasypus novemcinctus TaxID=9361 RepID=UPI000C85AC4D|nr:olfactory receptor 14C36-like [Dasypus novemcinctus]